MSGRTQRARRAAAALAVLAAGLATGALAQPSGAIAIHGTVQTQQLGNSMLVTTTNGAGTQHSVIDWRSFSVPANSVTHFLQPGADSTSINRVTGNKPSEIFGTLSSNGRLVLVNPSGIAVGKGAVIDTAGFTASALGMSDGDAIAGRLRFSNDHGKAGVDVHGAVLARSGDVVFLGTDINVAKEAVLSAPNGSVILAAGQRISLTGRGLEGILLEVSSPGDRATNMGRLEGDAVGMFAAQLKHTGVIQANHVILQADKVRLERGGDKDKEKDKDKGKDGKDKDDKGGSSGGTSGGGTGSGTGSTGGTETGSGGGAGGGTDTSGGTDTGSSGGTTLADLQGGVIDTSPNASNGTSGGSSGSSGPSDNRPPDTPPALAALQARATEAILHAPQELAALQAPSLTKDPAVPGKRRADPALQCTP